MPENEVENVQPRKLLHDSPNVKEIDALLMSTISLTDVKAKVREKYGERYSHQTFQARRQKLGKLALDANLACQDSSAAMVKMNETLVNRLKILGELAERILDKKIDANDPEYRQLEAFKNLVKSMLQRSAEMFEDVDFLGYLRFTINMQKLRMTRLFALELQTGITMRDNTENARVMIDLLERGIQMHKELGLKPTFGDPNINRRMNANSGSLDPLAQSQAERGARTDAIEKTVEGLTGEERDQRIRDILFKRIVINESN